MEYLNNDEYVYYYKGHPITRTDNCEGNLDKFTKAGMLDLDSTIPFEIIYFFSPDVFGSLVVFVNNSELDFSVYNIDILDSHKHYKKNAAGIYEEVQLTGEY